LFNQAFSNDYFRIINAREARFSYTGVYTFQRKRCNTWYVCLSIRNVNGKNRSEDNVKEMKIYFLFIFNFVCLIATGIGLKLWLDAQGIELPFFAQLLMIGLFVFLAAINNELLKKRKDKQR
jgi:hypothetical protein